MPCLSICPFCTNNSGQLGNGNQVTPQTTPQAVVGIEGAVKELITSPYQFTCALLINDTVTCWGSNSLGQLGRGSIGGDFPTPAPVLGFNPGVGVRSVTLAAESTFIVFNNGSAVSFGSCGSGTLGNGCLGSAGNTGTPTPMGLSNVDSIAAGDYHACALFTGGSVSCAFANSTLVCQVCVRGAGRKARGRGRFGIYLCNSLHAAGAVVSHPHDTAIVPTPSVCRLGIQRRRAAWSRRVSGHVHRHTRCRHGLEWSCKTDSSRSVTQLRSANERLSAVLGLPNARPAGQRRGRRHQSYAADSARPQRRGHRHLGWRRLYLVRLFRAGWWRRAYDPLACCF